MLVNKNSFDTANARRQARITRETDKKEIRLEEKKEQANLLTHWCFFQTKNRESQKKNEKEKVKVVRVYPIGFTNLRLSTNVCVSDLILIGPYTIFVSKHEKILTLHLSTSQAAPGYSRDILVRAVCLEGLEKVFSTFFLKTELFIGGIM